MLHAARGSNEKVVSAWKTYLEEKKQPADRSVAPADVLESVLTAFIALRPKYHADMISFLKNYAQHMPQLTLDVWVKMIPALIRGNDLGTLVAEFGEGANVAFAAILRYAVNNRDTLADQLTRIMDELPVSAYSSPIVREQLVVAIDSAEKPYARIKSS
jgi:hypothetical protein